MTPKEIKEHFKGLSLDEEACEYLDYNAERYSMLLETVQEFRSLIPTNQATIMDVGPSFFTALLSHSLKKDRICMLGLDAAGARGGHWPPSLRIDGSYYHFDLNDCQYPDKWIKVPKCDLIIAAETLEHLHTAPTLVCRFFKSFLNPGGVLIVTVPNAAALIKRLALLVGKHPYEMIRENNENPGHFREYTKLELERIGAQSGFKVLKIHHYNDSMPMEKSKRNSLKGRMLLALTKMSFPSMHNNLEAVYRMNHDFQAIFEAFFANITRCRYARVDCN